MSETPTPPMVAVDGLALRQVLVALNGGSPSIEELQAVCGFDNPISRLTDQFNEFVRNQPPETESP